MALSRNILASCLLLMAINEYATAQNATTNNATALAVGGSVPVQPYGYPYAYPMPQPNSMPKRYPMRVPVQPYRAQPVAMQPVGNATAPWAANPYAYYPYQQPANEYSQVMNIFSHPSQYYEPQYYLVPIANQTASQQTTQA